MFYLDFSGEEEKGWWRTLNMPHRTLSQGSKRRVTGLTKELEVEKYYSKW
jgi:hypothetical protein